MQQTTIHLVRHGQSEANVQRRLSSAPPGPGLTDLGRLQARAAGELLLQSSRPPQVIVTSPMRRTVETAMPLSRALGVAPCRVAELTETQFGAWDGWQVDALIESSRAFRDWLVDPELTPPPAGEALSSVAHRVRSCLTRVAAAHAGQSVAAFSHMHALQGFVMLLQGAPWKMHPDFEMPNACIVTAHWQPCGWRLGGIDVSANRPDAAREVS